MRRPAVITLAVALAVAGAPGRASEGWGRAAPAGRPAVDRFDQARAWGDLAMQVRFGPRPAGSPASRRLAVRLRGMLPAGRLEPVPGGLRNVVGSLPGRGRPILLGAHYDTKAITGFVGADDGASGVAVVLGVVRALRRAPRRCERPLRVVLWDGEESPGPGDGEDFASAGMRGSRADAAWGARPHAVIAVDMVGDRDLSIPREAFSSARLWGRLRAAAARAGTVEAFPPAPRSGILDDHLPYLRRGVPAIDVIDLDYAPWHTTGDTLGRVSTRSLDTVGETLVEMLRAMRRETCRHSRGR